MKTTTRKTGSAKPSHERIIANALEACMRHTPADYFRLASDGMTARQAADALGVAPNTVISMKTRHGITFAKAKIGRPSNRTHDGGLPRQAMLKAMGSRAWTAPELATHIGIETKSARYHLSVLLAAGHVECATNTARAYLWRAKPKGAK